MTIAWGGSAKREHVGVPACEARSSSSGFECTKPGLEITAGGVEFPYVASLTNYPHLTTANDFLESHSHQQPVGRLARA